MRALPAHPGRARGAGDVAGDGENMKEMGLAGDGPAIVAIFGATFVAAERRIGLRAGPPTRRGAEPRIGRGDRKGTIVVHRQLGRNQILLVKSFGPGVGRSPAAARPPSVLRRLADVPRMSESEKFLVAAEREHMQNKINSSRNLAESVGIR